MPRILVGGGGGSGDGRRGRGEQQLPGAKAVTSRLVEGRLCWRHYELGTYVAGRRRVEAELAGGARRVSLLDGARFWHGILPPLSVQIR